METTNSRIDTPSESASGGQHGCNQCSLRFTRSSDVDRHIRNIHEGVKDSMCKYCGKEFAQKSNMSRHVKTVHEKAQSARKAVAQTQPDPAPPSGAVSAPSLPPSHIMGDSTRAIAGRRQDPHTPVQALVPTAPAKFAFADGFGPRKLPPLVLSDDEVPRPNLPPLWSLGLPGGPPQRERLLSMPAVHHSAAGHPQAGAAYVGPPLRPPGGPQQAPALHRPRTTSLASHGGGPPPNSTMANGRAEPPAAYRILSSQKQAYPHIAHLQQARGAIP